ncbi:MAG TPA: ubiquinone/menaquinone biosynthesis methyltransferase [Microthrixaceae bacterium]|nr:ubiquinone/menaquinone biosynthesis methyltransferase [Microthrixaceae bacterium]
MSSSPTSDTPTSRKLIPKADEPLPTGDDKTQAVQAMFDVIAPRYDLVNRVMTFRMDVGWRRRTVSALGLAPGSTVVDLACGTGDLSQDLARRGLVPIGVDLSYGMLAAAPKQFARLQGDGSAMPFPEASVDGATCGFALRNFTDLAETFAELARIVRPGGRIALLEVATPPNPLLRFGHGIYFGQVVPRIGAALSDGDAYRYLPRSVEYLPDPDEMVAMLERVGFSDVRRTLLSVGISQLITATRSQTGGVSTTSKSSAGDVPA